MKSSARICDSFVSTSDRCQTSRSSAGWPACGAENVPEIEIGGQFERIDRLARGVLEIERFERARVGFEDVPVPMPVGITDAGLVEIGGIVESTSTENSSGAALIRPSTVKAARLRGAVSASARGVARRPGRGRDRDPEKSRAVIRQTSGGEPEAMACCKSRR
jgi:hypothetical protein